MRSRYDTYSDLIDPRSALTLATYLGKRNKSGYTVQDPIASVSKNSFFPSVHMCYSSVCTKATDRTIHEQFSALALLEGDNR